MRVFARVRKVSLYALMVVSAVGSFGDTSGAVPDLKTVIIDAGHGGHDPGAVNRWGLREKDVTLQVARRVRDYLAKNSSYRIVMTRDSDKYLTLQERCDVANAHDPASSVFISVHVNAAESSSAKGAETYVYKNEATNTRAARVAARENLGTGFSLDFIFADMRHRAMAPLTEGLASNIQSNLIKRANVLDRRVQEGPFYVLFYTQMPSTLVEIGFLTNKDEQTQLRSAAHQQKLAEAIGAGVVEFGAQFKNWNVAVAPSD